MKYSRLLSVCWFLFFSVCFFISAGFSFGKDTISIGIVGPMEFDNGLEIWNGAILAAEEINQRGGVRVGRKRMHLKLVKADSKEITSADYARNTMEKLCMYYNVDFVVGGFRSEAVMAMQDVAMDYRKIFVSIGAALPDLCNRVAQNYDRYKYYFRNGVFNNNHLAKVSFLQLAFVARILKNTLGLETVRVAIAAEKAVWVDGMVKAAAQKFPQLGLELAGVYYMSPIATNVSSVIEDIADTHAPLVFTLFSSTAGEAFVSQAAELKLPALQVGVNVEAQKHTFWEDTDGKANYTITFVPFCDGVEITKLTGPFLKNYVKRFGVIPSFTSGSYTTIMHTLVPAIEQAGSLNPDILVSIIENRRYETPQGVFAYEKDSFGRHLHDPKFGVKYAMLLGAQWRDGRMKGIWPYNYQENAQMAPLTYKGIVGLDIPPWMMNLKTQ